MNDTLTAIGGVLVVKKNRSAADPNGGMSSSPILMTTNAPDSADRSHQKSRAEIKRLVR
jgi:hypothetical protein